MPLTADNFVQENSGITTRPIGSTSISVTLPSGTTAGNTVVCVITSLIGITGVPAGWVFDKTISSSGNLYALRGSEVAASETSWTFTFTSLGADADFSWYVAELSGVDPVEPMDASATNTDTSLANSDTFASGTTPLNAALDTVLLAAFSVNKAAAGDAASWAGYTNDFEEVADNGSTATPMQLGVARKFITGTTGQFSATATYTTSGASSSGQALIVAYRAADSPIVAPLLTLAGMEWGTHGGINSHGGASSMMGNALATNAGTWGTSYLIQAGSARNSSYGLRVVQSAAAATVQVGQLTGGACAIGMDVRVVSATGTVEVAAIGSGGAQAFILYDASATKFGVRVGTTGTVSWESGTTATNTWVWIDVRLKIDTSTHRAEWRIETAADTYTDQAAAELTGQSPFAFSNAPLLLGRNAAQTMTADYDNICLSAYWVAYPLGPHQIRLLTVDPAGTPTVSGTATNFSRFTANGTLAAIDAATAALLVDEVPPTVSASADGVCQTATAASDYIEFPMAASTVAADEIVAGVRMLAAMWGGAGAGTGTVGIRSWDGTTETTLIPASTAYDAGSPTAVSSTEPRWQCAMWPAPNGWTKAMLDGAALRFGFSTDAAPDMGTDAMYLEYATRKAATMPLFGTMASQAVNPNTLGIRSVTVDTNVDPGKAAELYYEESGSPTTVPVGADTSHIETIDAPDAPTVNYIALYPDPEP